MENSKYHNLISISLTRDFRRIKDKKAKNKTLVNVKGSHSLEGQDPPSNLMPVNLKRDKLRDPEDPIFPKRPKTKYPETPKDKSILLLILIAMVPLIISDLYETSIWITFILFSLFFFLVLFPINLYFEDPKVVKSKRMAQRKEIIVGSLIATVAIFFLLKSVFQWFEDPGFV